MTSSRYETASTTTADTFSHPRTFSGSLSGAVKDVQAYLRNYAPAILPADLLEATSATSSVVWRSTHASAFELQKYAWDRLARIRSAHEADPSNEALQSLKAVIDNFVTENGPTPQMGSTASGSVELQWLSNGTLVSALFDVSGEYNIFAADAEDDVLFDEDVAAGDAAGETLGAKLRALLAEMGAAVTVRPLSWK